MPTKRRLLGDMLIEKGYLSSEQLEAGLREHQKTGRFLGTTLKEFGFISEEQLLLTLSEQLGIPYVKLSQTRVEPQALHKVPPKFATHYKLLPLRFTDDTLTVATSDPLAVHTLDELKLLLGYEIQPVLASAKDIEEAIRNHYGVGATTIESMLAQTTSPVESAPAKAATFAETAEELIEDASIIKFVNQIIHQAHQDRATDIHIEPYENLLRVRFRIDGVLYDTAVPPNLYQFQQAIVSRIKIMAKLDIAERRLPQDGRIQFRMGGTELDLRVSVLPTPFGESVGIRLLTPGQLYELERLGLNAGQLAILQDLIAKPHGILFVTGPTGSGKTTTLYACLNRINSTERKIITIEDPIEYQINGITQIQIHPKIGLSFAAGLRSMLRHDPDVIMVGEVRDIESAEITIRTALTGHLVFSTLHTNDAAGGVTRLLDMGIEPYLVASSVECFIAQRLVRVVCQGCKRPAEVSPDVLAQFNHPAAAPVQVFEGKGCEQCKLTGYRGRTAIYEFLMVDDTIRDLIVKHTSATQIRDAAVRQGMATLRQDGWQKVLQGITTPAEVMRVT